MTLYIGVTNNLKRRISEHKKGHGSEFTSQLVKTMNPTWSDLSADWLE